MKWLRLLGVIIVNCVIIVHFKFNIAENMSIQTLTLSKGLTCRHLHLDQVTVLFRPSEDIGSTEFQQGDNAELPWRVETAKLMVRI